ncbi:hypothetical protein [Moraxella cuniculi]|uniref:Uncharacterized protein n=1 Tax=Moraxella cuniculi TaxID=34061 RepID=A0A448GUS9_9GAMM|nr:hypothetical protein [Moraxella cuniculi]VEG12541.1 Uncharacterised protein [Moraxella cuniculi]
MTTTTPTSTTKKKLPWSKITLGVVLAVMLVFQVFQFMVSKVLFDDIKLLEWKHKVGDKELAIENQNTRSRVLENEEKIHHLEAQVKKVQ